jgi:hypothetical protein
LLRWGWGDLLFGVVADTRDRIRMALGTRDRVQTGVNDDAVPQYAAVQAPHDPRPMRSSAAHLLFVGQAFSAFSVLNKRPWRMLAHSSQGLTKEVWTETCTGYEEEYQREAHSRLKKLLLCPRQENKEVQ